MSTRKHWHGPPRWTRARGPDTTRDYSQSQRIRLNSNNALPKRHIGTASLRRHRRHTLKGFPKEAQAARSSAQLGSLVGMAIGGFIWPCDWSISQAHYPDETLIDPRPQLVTQHPHPDSTRLIGEV